MRLTRRERVWVLGAIAVLALFGGYQGFVRPSLERIQTLKRVLVEREHELADMRAKAAEYAALQAEAASLRNRVTKASRDFSILAFIEKVEKEVGISQNVVSVQPTTSAISETYVERIVDVRFEKVTLEQVTGLLLRLQDAQEPLRVSAVTLSRPAGEGALLDASVQVRALALTGAQPGQAEPAEAAEPGG
ncbi:MAG TPA: type II secretion system protein GspM [Candidatus Brocadiia bacterium]|nr:type II secretion system protein GspM [Candidatus Brocadiia bacterium]